MSRRSCIQGDELSARSTTQQWRTLPVARPTARFAGSARRGEHQLVASYSAGCDITAESDATGTKLDIAATDHIRPIATTTPIVHASICIPSTSRSASIFFRRPNVRQFTDAQSFLREGAGPALLLARPLVR